MNTSILNLNVKKILHITPHLGGGVGRVLLNYLIRAKESYSFSHKITCLDYANENALEIAAKNNIEITDNACFEPQRILAEIQKADIILFHWWNHPLLIDFLVRQKLPPSRVIFWSHISGFHPPYVFTQKALCYPDKFVFTTPVSFKTKEVKTYQNKNKLCSVWSTGGIDHVRNIKLKSHNGFNIGYIGTVDYCKMHPDFLKINNAIDIPDIKFIICGSPNHNEIKQESKNLGIADKFNFTGQISDISKYLCEFDIFGYPLAPYHYGTCDQALAESMAAGVVPVVLSNKMEKYMVKHKITGLVANTPEDYIKAVKYLYDNPAYKQKLSKNAKEYAFKTFSLNKMTDEWERVFNEVLNLPKTRKEWHLSIKSPTAADVFLESLGAYGDDFRFNRTENIKKLAESPLWRTKTRGTVHHYSNFFKDDELLSGWSKLMQLPN